MRNVIVVRDYREVICRAECEGVLGPTVAYRRPASPGYTLKYQVN